MAWGILAKPGSKHGPCKGTCAHVDCAANRKTAEALCPDCGKSIGWNTPFVYYQGKPWHNSCLEIMVERNLKPKVQRRNP